MSLHKFGEGHSELLFALLCFIWLFSGCASPIVLEIREPFEMEIRAKLDPQMQLVTNRKTYDHSQVISYQVINQKNRAIYFEDFAFGIRAYEYDPQSHKWSQLSLMRDLSDPERVVVPPGFNKNVVNFYFLDPSDIPKTGSIRLVVIGWLDPSNPENSKIAAFADIVILP
jgi:hypothetical protein